MRRELVRNLRERLRADPGGHDRLGLPERLLRTLRLPEVPGRRCRRRRGPAGTLLRFVNAVAADLEAEFPEWPSTRSPTSTPGSRPGSSGPGRTSLSASAASSARSPGRSTIRSTSPSSRTSTAGREIAGRLFVWDYTTNFSHYVQPHPNYGVLGPNLRLFTKKNVRGVFEQGAYQSWGSEMAELRAWVLAKLLWDPASTRIGLRDDFLKGYYGPAAGALDDFLETLEAAVDRSGDALGCYSPADAGFLSLDTLLRSRRILDRAERRARRSAEFGRRVRRAGLPVEYVVVTRWEELRDEARRTGKALALGRSRGPRSSNCFLAAAREQGVTMISEVTVPGRLGRQGRPEEITTGSAF
ncbi:MAG: DUF4838 domain-containing protein [Candidatus Moduliflexus flocculans]|nr:DUF4838 domain-containing protein [Candidatus Moduliflexus flocculans]